jgi:hypothetical protein
MRFAFLPRELVELFGFGTVYFSNARVAQNNVLVSNGFGVLPEGLVPFELRLDLHKDHRLRSFVQRQQVREQHDDCEHEKKIKDCLGYPHVLLTFLTRSNFGGTPLR